MTAYCHACLRRTDTVTVVADPNDVVQSLSRIAAAAVRLMATIHRSGVLVDPDEEVPHMRANIDHITGSFR